MTTRSGAAGAANRPAARRTTVIYVGSVDDPDSVLHLLGQAGGGEIRLVVGRLGSPMATPVDLKRLARRLRDYPANLELVSRHRNVRALARSLGVKASSSLDGRSAIRRLVEYPVRATMRTFGIAGGDTARDAHSEHYRVSLQEVLAGPVFLAGMAFAAIWALFFFLLPTTTVTIALRTMEMSVEFRALADPSVQVANAESGVIPGRIVEVEIEGFRSAPATGSELIAGARSSGVVTLRNLTAGTVLIPKGTVVSTKDGVRYSTAAEIELPASLTDSEEEDEPAGLEVAVAAMEAGSDANVPEDSIVTIEGPLRFSVQVLSSSEMTGGSQREVSRASEQDRIELRRLLLEELLAEGVSRLQGSGAAGELVNVWPVGALNPTVVESRFSPSNEDGDLDVGLTMRIKVLATVFSQSDANRLVDAALVAGASEGAADFQIFPNSVVYDQPVIDRVGGGRVALVLTGRGVIIHLVDTEEMERNLLDINVEQAEAYLDGVDAVSDYEIDRWGPLTERTARLPFRIEVKITQELDRAQ
ncbi:MAG: baseplate J/gp47 family protein [Chloroflexi bacterium]|nr:baseplate J/gp47 family protein [Chloroflexota bacterium]MCY3938306.1 baseplate J/gp47 family protein [Chloroflexota bacterium]